jgi:glycosyltransferase involved in cell wall biosynthesis
VTSPRPTLSICVPTYNRLRHLERALDRLFAPDCFPFPIEVVLSDNASSDETGALAERMIARGAPLRYHRHATNLGALANIFSALRRARGEFVLYLADDDRLEAGNLADAVAWMRANPHCVASYGPILTFDQVDGVAHSLTYSLDADVEFERSDRLGLVRFLAERRITPEVGVFRTAALADTLFLSHNIHWAFTMIDRLIELGSVRFRTAPHYVGLIRQWPGDEVRLTACMRWGLEDWESCRRGLWFLYGAAQVAGQRPASAEAQRALEAELDAFGDYFRNQAIYTVARTGRLSEALDIIKLLRGEGALHDHDPALAPLAAAGTAAALHAILEVVDQAGDVAVVALYGFGGHAATLAGAFKTVRPALEVTVAEPPQALPDPERALVIVPDDATRCALVAGGLLSGRVLWLGGVMAHFDLTRWLDHAPGA